MSVADKIHSTIINNCKPEQDRCIGVEIECLYYGPDGHRLPVNPGEKFSASDMRTELETILAPEQAGFNLTLEPGGQLEWASPPCKTLFDIDRFMSSYFEAAGKISEREQLIHLDFSLDPRYVPEDIQLIAENKYRIMNDRFALTGDQGSWMMRNTASVQINLDFSTEEEAAEMAHIGDVLSPLAAIAFSHSPFRQGKPVGLENIRYQVWENTDRERCGYLLDKGLNQPDNLIRQYVDMVIGTPAIFVRGTDEQLSPFGGPLGTWLDVLEENRVLQQDHILLALHQIFTHVRFKNVLELRISDRPPAGSELAPAAFWLGLLYSEPIRKQTREEISLWTEQERFDLNLLARQLDMDQAGPRGKPIRYWINHFMSLALQGLDDHSRGLERSERVYLERYLDIILQGGSPTIQVQDQFWQRGVSLQDFIVERYSPF
ncbi:MAG: glutamate-cysteine ligase family protein [Fidelibacterota bacterium]